MGEKMKNSTLVTSTANLAVGGSQQVLNILLLLLLARGVDPRFDKPIIWMVLGSCSLLIGIHLFKRYNITFQPHSSKPNQPVFVIKNPILLWVILLFFTKKSHSIYSLTGTYQFLYEGDHIQIVQLNSPNAFDHVKDFLLFLLVVCTLITSYMLLYKVDILKYGLTIIFCFVYLSVFIQKALMMWCYSKVSIEVEHKVYVSPLLCHPAKLGSTFLKNVLLNPHVLTYGKLVQRYIISHEKGHIESHDYFKGLFIDIWNLLLGLLFCYLEPNNPGIAPLALLPIILIFLIYVPFAGNMEKKADVFAAERIGVDHCIQALRFLQHKIKDEQLIEETSFLSVVLRIFHTSRGMITLEERIKHLELLHLPKDL
jgi:hypothetical protein